MAKPKTETRVLKALYETDGLSNARLRADLNLSESSYKKTKESLIQEALIEKYRCRGGGVRLSKLGEERTEQLIPKVYKSEVPNEKGLYAPLLKYLENQAKEDEVPAVVIDTSAIKSRGKWQNPDLTEVAVHNYPYLDKSSIVLTTYEVKPWGRWNVQTVFEAAAHRRFSHYSFVVLEWVKGAEFSLSSTEYRINEIARECQRFGVGLATMRKFYKGYRLYQHLDAEQHSPGDDEAERWLEIVFKRHAKDEQRFFELRESRSIGT